MILVCTNWWFIHSVLCSLGFSVRVEDRRWFFYFLITKNFMRIIHYIIHHRINQSDHFVHWYCILFWRPYRIWEILDPSLIRSPLPTPSNKVTLSWKRSRCSHVWSHSRQKILRDLRNKDFWHQKRSESWILRDPFGKLLPTAFRWQNLQSKQIFLSKLT